MRIYQVWSRCKDIHTKHIMMHSKFNFDIPFQIYSVFSNFLCMYMWLRRSAKYLSCMQPRPLSVSLSRQQLEI